jgi:hypothetical protein
MTDFDPDLHMKEASTENNPDFQPGGYYHELLKQHRELQTKIIQSEWVLAYQDRGMGHGDYGVMVDENTGIPKNFTFVCSCQSRDIAEHIIQLHNASLK